MTRNVVKYGCAVMARQPGAGIDIDLTRNLGLRTGLNGRFIRGDNGFDTNQFHFIVGVVFGRR